MTDTETRALFRAHGVGATRGSLTAAHRRAGVSRETLRKLLRTVEDGGPAVSVGTVRRVADRLDVPADLAERAWLVDRGYRQATDTGEVTVTGLLEQAGALSRQDLATLQVEIARLLHRSIHGRGDG